MERSAMVKYAVQDHTDASRMCLTDKLNKQPVTVTPFGSADAVKANWLCEEDPEDADESAGLSAGTLFAPIES